MRHLLGAAALVWIALGLTATQTAAQDSTCTPLLEEGFSAVEQHCSALDMNAACYGFGTVSATFAGSAEESFSQPGDRAPLASLQTLQTAALDPALGQWGVALMNVQANVPASMGNQGVKYILFGGAQIENGVAAQDAAAPFEPIDATVLVGANVRTAPGTDSRVITSVPPGTVLKADGISEDGAWVRVQHEGESAWVSLDLLAVSADGLPVATDDANMTPMQKIYFQSAPEGATCADGLPSMLVVQGPDGVTVDLVVNGANVNLSSTVVFWIGDGKLHAMTLVGVAKIDGFYVPAGFTIEAKLSEDGRSLDGTWTNFRPMDADERETMKPLEQIPPDLLDYPIVLPTEAEIQAVLKSVEDNTSQNTGNNNNNGGGGGTTQNVSTGDVDCSRFRPTAPTEGMSNSSETFYWDAAQGADNYQLKIFNDGGALVGTFMTNSSNTALTVDTSDGALGGGFFFSWQVDAMYNGQVVCSTNLLGMPRGGGPQNVSTGGGDDGDTEGNGDGNNNPGSGSGWEP